MAQLKLNILQTISQSHVNARQPPCVKGAVQCDYAFSSTIILRSGLTAMIARTPITVIISSGTM